MYIFYGFVIVFMFGLWIRAKLLKLTLPNTDVAYSKPFLAPAVLICKRVREVRIHIPLGGKASRYSVKNHKLATNLQTLNPGEESDLQLDRFQAEKVSNILLIVTVGALLGLAISLMAINQGVLKDGKDIYRSTYGGMDVEANLTAGIIQKDGEVITDVDVVVPARVYSFDEAEELFNQMDGVIDELILSNNDSMNHVISNVSLVKKVDGYPFSINWECSNYEYLDTDGVVHNEDLEEPVEVVITGDCVYEHEHWYLMRKLNICPQELSMNEQIYKELLEKIKSADENMAALDHISLPTKIDYGEVKWIEKINDDSGLVVLGIIIICVMVPVFMETEINRKLKRRSKELLIEYPAFVSKLTLYMGAGMSVRNCFYQMSRQYEKRKNKRLSYLGQEVIITAHELQMGISETECYERFGKRCGSREYMRFSALLTQNLRKGSTDLIRLLQKESEDAFVLRKNEARKLGEEASTKLLLPMVMMLAVVMIIIMVPAYMSFSS